MYYPGPEVSREVRADKRGTTGRGTDTHLRLYDLVLEQLTQRVVPHRAHAHARLLLQRGRSGLCPLLAVDGYQHDHRQHGPR